MAPFGTFTGLDGTMGVIDNGWLGHGPAGLAYIFGDVFCHQQESRCLILNGSQMPVCIRDAGIFLGLAVGFAATLVIGECIGRPVWLWIGVVLCAVTVAEWFSELVLDDMPVTRFVSGIVSGAGAAIILSWMLYRDTTKRLRPARDVRS